MLYKDSVTSEAPSVSVRNTYIHPMKVFTRASRYLSSFHGCTWMKSICQPFSIIVPLCWPGYRFIGGVRGSVLQTEWQAIVGKAEDKPEKNSCDEDFSNRGDTNRGLHFIDQIHTDLFWQKIRTAERKFQSLFFFQPKMCVCVCHVWNVWRSLERPREHRIP